MHMEDQDLESFFTKEELKSWLYAKVIISHVLVHGRPRLGADNQMENCVCTSRYCVRS
jgi:hypothetical protein